MRKNWDIMVRKMKIVTHVVSCVAGACAVFTVLENQRSDDEEKVIEELQNRISVSCMSENTGKVSVEYESWYDPELVHIPLRRWENRYQKNLEFAQRLHKNHDIELVDVVSKDVNVWTDSDDGRYVKATYSISKKKKSD